MATKIVKPSNSCTLSVPVEVQEEYDGSVSSFWRPGESLLLQLSSYIRNEGEQVGAAARLRDRVSKLAGKADFWKTAIYPDLTVDQATAQFSDEDGVLWVHAYLVWPHLAVYVTISGPPEQVKDRNNWAITSLQTLRLTIH